MIKLVGYIPMKKKKGKVLFIEQDGSNSVVGKVRTRYFCLMIYPTKLNRNILDTSLLYHTVWGIAGKPMFLMCR